MNDEATTEFHHGHAAGSPRKRIFTARCRLPVCAAEAFAWHKRGAFVRLKPPFEPVRMVSQSGGIGDGGRAELETWVGPWRQRWFTEQRNFDPPRQFQDVQLSGPFAEFAHTHRIIPSADGRCELEDVIEYRLPFGWLGDLFGRRFVERKLEKIFRYRQNVTIHDLAAEMSVKELVPMKILISGATGLIGRTLTTLLTTAGHEVFRLSRRTPTEANDIQWNPVNGEIPNARLEGLDAVVHLAGENIAQSRWTDAVKRKMRSSRVDGTRLLSNTLAELQSPPKCLICASAIGYYGDRGAETLTENSPPGSGYLPELCVAWEDAAEPARAKGIRVVSLRIGVVLSPEGGALASMLTPFKLGVGGIVGDGKQYWSWIALDDVVGAIHHCLTQEPIAGPVNAVAPNPATNADFTTTLGGVLHRPTIFPLPAFAAKLALGEMADELLLCSARVVPQRLQETGYRFRCPTLESALRHVLGK